MDLDDEELEATRRLNGVAKDNIEDIENIRSFLLKTESGRELRLVEKENYDKLVKRIKELETKQKEMCEEYCPKAEIYKKKNTELSNQLLMLYNARIDKKNAEIEKLKVENKKLNKRLDEINKTNYPIIN